MRRVTLILFGVFLFSCTTQNEKDLNGVWKFVSGNYTFSDTSMTISDNKNLKSIKIYGDTRYSLVTQNEVEKYFSAKAALKPEFCMPISIDKVRPVRLSNPNNLAVNQPAKSPVPLCKMTAIATSIPDSAILG